MGNHPTTAAEPATDQQQVQQQQHGQDEGKADVADFKAVSSAEEKGEANNAADEPEPISAEDDLRILRRVDWALQFPVMAIYFLVTLDKSSLSYASVFGIQADAHLTDVANGYSQVASSVYIAQAVFQLASAYAIVKVRLSVWMGALVVLWGATLAATAAATSFGGMYAGRFVLGALESSIAPSLVALTQTWYKRSEQGWRTCSWYAQNGVSTIVGSAIAYGLGMIHSPALHPYQIIFLTLGLLTVVYGFSVFFTIPDSIETARFLRDDGDRRVARERVRYNQGGSEARQFSWAQVIECFLDLKTWMWFSIAFLVSIPSGGFSSFQALILQSFGFDSYQVMLLSMPVGFMQIVYCVVSFWAATKLKVKAPIIIASLLISLVGAIMLYVVGRGVSDRVTLLVAYYLTVAYIAITPLGFAWHAANVAGKTKKTVLTAFWVVGQGLGNIVGPQLFQSADSPYYRNGLRASLIILVVLVGVVCGTVVYLWALNVRNEKRRTQAGLQGRLADYSMMTAAEAAHARAEEEKTGAAASGRHGAHAFEDLTDLQNPEFIYVY